MAYIHIPRKRFEQPQGRLQPRAEWADRLASLIHFGTSGPLDVIDLAANYVRTGAAAIEPNAHGIGLRIGAGGTTKGYIESSGAMAGWSGEPTLVFFFPEIGATQGATGGMLHAIPKAQKYTQFVDTNTSSLYVLGNGPCSLEESLGGTRNRSLILRAVSGDPCFFIDRRKVSGVVGTINTGAKTIRFGAWGDGSYNFNGVYGSIATVKGAVSDAEALALVENPWLMYSDDPIRFYSLAGGGVPISISVAASNITSSGARITATLGF